MRRSNFSAPFPVHHRKHLFFEVALVSYLVSYLPTCFLPCSILINHFNHFFLVSRPFLLHTFSSDPGQHGGMGEEQFERRMYCLYRLKDIPLRVCDYNQTTVLVLLRLMKLLF